MRRCAVKTRASLARTWLALGLLLGSERRRAAIGWFLDGLSDKTPRFTVLQHSSGFLHPWPDEMLVFGAGGVGKIPLPLRMPGLEPDFAPRQRDYRVTFMGRSDGANDRLGVRAKMLRVFEGRPEFVRFPLEMIPKLSRIGSAGPTLSSVPAVSVPRPSGFTRRSRWAPCRSTSTPAYHGSPTRTNWTGASWPLSWRTETLPRCRTVLRPWTRLRCKGVRKNSRGLQPLLYHSRHCQVGPAATRGPRRGTFHATLHALQQRRTSPG